MLAEEAEAGIAIERFPSAATGGDAAETTESLGAFGALLTTLDSPASIPAVVGKRPSGSKL